MSNFVNIAKLLFGASLVVDAFEVLNGDKPTLGDLASRLDQPPGRATALQERPAVTSPRFRPSTNG